MVIEASVFYQFDTLLPLILRVSIYYRYLNKSGRKLLLGIRNLICTRNMGIVILSSVLFFFYTTVATIWPILTSAFEVFCVTDYLSVFLSCLGLLMVFFAILQELTASAIYSCRSFFSGTV